MITLKYTKASPGHIRILTSEDLADLGIELKSDLVWDPSNHHRVEVSDRNAEVLLAKMPKDFEVVTDEEVEELEAAEAADEETPEEDTETVDEDSKPDEEDEEDQD